MSVNRYEFELYHCNGGEMLVSETGYYVSYEDYAALELKLAKSQREFRAAGATIENLQMQVEKLAAELSAVEAIHNEAVLISDEHYEQCPPEVQKMIRSLAALQIPAYGAFLAEARAQGVEMFASSLKVAGGHEHPYSAVANEFAAQLRKGVQP